MSLEIAALDVDSMPVRDQLLFAVFSVSHHAFQTHPTAASTRIKSWSVKVGKENIKDPFIDVTVKFLKLHRELIWPDLKEAEIVLYTPVNRDEQRITARVGAEPELFENDFSRLFLAGLGNYWHNAKNICLQVTAEQVKPVPTVVSTLLSNPSAADRPARPPISSGVGILMGPAL